MVGGRRRDRRRVDALPRRFAGKRPHSVDGYAALPGGTAPYITDFAAAPGYAVVCLADGAGSCVLQIVDGQSGDISATIRPSVVDYTFAVSGNRLYLRNRNAGTMDVYALPSGEKADSFAIVPEAQEVAAYAVDGENQQIVFLTMDGVFQAGFGSSVKQTMVPGKRLCLRRTADHRL